MLLLFDTYYLVESDFSGMTCWLSKVRNRLDFKTRRDFSLVTDHAATESSKLAGVHQTQGTHCIYCNLL